MARSRKDRHRDNRGAAEGHYFQTYEWFMASTAWWHSTPYERALYLELKRRYNGRNNGDISLSHREAEYLLRVSNTAVEKAFKGLQVKGLIKAQQKGGFDWKLHRQGKHHGRATRWLLTELPQDIPVRVLSGGTKEFMRWQPGMDFTEKSAVRPERANGPSTADHSENMARSERTIEPKVSARAGR